MFQDVVEMRSSLKKKLNYSIRSSILCCRWAVECPGIREVQWSEEFALKENSLGESEF